MATGRMVHRISDRGCGYFIGALLLIGLCSGLIEQARADVGLIGVISNRAIVSINGAPARTLSPGQEYQGVKLISAQGETATLMIEGKRRIMRIGQNATGDLNGNSDATVTLVPDSRGHFNTVGSINGMPVKFVVDTGASLVALGASDAKRLNLNLKNAQEGFAQTANGPARVLLTKLETVRVGDIVLNNVDGSIHPDQDMPFALLGMSFLNRVNMNREGDTLTMKKRF